MKLNAARGFLATGLRPTATACSNCIKYGAECPGYEKGLKFVAGKHAVRSRGQNQRRSYETQLDFSSAPATGSTLSTKEGASRSRVLTWQTFSQATRDVTSNHQGALGIPASLREPVLPFVYNMMGELFVYHPREDVMYSAPWFTSLLDHLGRSPVLDTAMCAFMLQLVGMSKDDKGEISRSRDLYGQSLRSLQRALNHPVAWKSTETLAATMICCQLELFAGTLDPLSWMMHAVGVSKLIQHRGRRSFSTPFEKALLRGCRPLLITQCLFYGDDCFLDQPQWQKLSATLSLGAIGDEEGNEGTLKPSGAVDLSWSGYHDRYYMLLAKVPPVTRIAYDLREDRKHGIAPDPSQVELLAQQAGRLRSEYHAWYDGAVSSGAITPPVEVLSQDPNSPFITVLKFSNPWIGSVFMGYWATMLILQEALNECQVGQERPHDESNQELARKILQSLEHVGRGIMGPFRVGYALRIAYEFADLPLQMWVESALEGYSQQYAAMSPETYPRLHGKSGPQLFNDAGGARTGL
ncbi:hypothetical protein VMCG_00464 [Cytospora schulzeri]|uniref:Zn(2)-C6 fungal-type domain-containing protein n=1 Tax=Cytospora schulzeri TaxID=448051 RepID=A0A423X8M1_9PEZI|nr:hypothetical protein VMCG_00464 [Valsa malicola]